MEKIYVENNELNKHLEGKVLVDFYADWCGPCKMLGAILDDIELDCKVVKVNVDTNEELARQYGVMSIPTMSLFNNGELVETRVGLLSEKELKEWVK